MFLDHLNKLRHTLAFRLTLWYATIFTISSCIAFLFFYFLITSVIRDQTDQELLQRVNQFKTVLSVQGINSVKRVAILEARAAGVKKIFVRLLYPSGEVFSSSNMDYWKDIHIGRNAIEQLLAGKRYFYETIVIPGHRHKVRILYGVIGTGIILQLGQSMEHHTRFIEAFQKIFVVTMVILIFIAALIGWFMAKRALSGVELVTRTARNISGGLLEKRVPVNHKGDEIDQLAITFNHMLDRVQTLVTGMKEMSDNIAHDLKSPVTRIRGLSEITLTTGGSRDDYETLAASTIEECDRLLGMINTMLDISKVEAGIDNLELEDIDLAEIMREACDLFGPIAEDRDVALLCDLPGTCHLKGDTPRLQRMVSNLMDNAIKYCRSGDQVHVSLREEDTNRVRLSVEDSGIGISEIDLPHIFKRFYRSDRSRSQTGSGLGLSLSRAVARSHGGDIAVVSTLGTGSGFTITLPKAPPLKPY